MHTDTALQCKRAGAKAVVYLKNVVQNEKLLPRVISVALKLVNCTWKGYEVYSEWKIENMWLWTRWARITISEILHTIMTSETRSFLPQKLLVTAGGCYLWKRKDVATNYCPYSSVQDASNWVDSSREFCINQVKTTSHLAEKEFWKSKKAKFEMKSIDSVKQLTEK